MCSFRTPLTRHLDAPQQAAKNSSNRALLALKRRASSLRTMKQLTYVGKGRLEWWDAPRPVLLAPTDALVRPFAVARCDIETAFFRHNLSPLLRLGVASHLLSPRLLDDFGARPLSGPMGVGHECVAQITEIGSEVSARRVGDVVVVPYQISCGACQLCNRGRTAQCVTERPSPISAFGGFADPNQAWGGMLSDSLRVPFADHMLVPLPPVLDPASYASSSDNMVDGYRAVAPHLKELPGAPVFVVGGRARSIGLYAVAAAVALGSEQVVYVDWDEERLRTAELLGATPLPGPFKKLSTSSKVLERFPISVEASGKSSGLSLAMKALSVCGTCTVVALHWAKTSKLPLWDMYARNLNLQTGLVDARSHLPELLQLASTGKLDARSVVTTVASWSDAPDALVAKSTKVVIERPQLAL